LRARRRASRPAGNGRRPPAAGLTKAAGRRLAVTGGGCHVDHLLSRGAPPPLADAVVCKRWPFPMRWDPTPSAVAPRVRAPQRLRAVLPTGMAAGAFYFLAGRIV